MSQNRKNVWLDHLCDTFDFFVHNAEFDEIIDYPKTPHLNIDPRSVASTNYVKLSKLKEYQKSKNIEEIRIPLIEIPIVDESNININEHLAQKHNGTFLIGGHIKFKCNKIIYYSYSICIVFATNDHIKPQIKGKTINVDSCCLHTCKNNKRIIRRIHFDYQPEDNLRHPFHVQIGGEFPNNESSFTDIHYCFEHFLSRPRLPYDKKIDYVSLFDFMIREFDSPLSKWRSNPQWNRLVEKSEELLTTVGNS